MTPVYATWQSFLVLCLSTVLLGVSCPPLIPPPPSDDMDETRITVDDPSSEVGEILVTSDGYKVAALVEKNTSGEPISVIGVIAIGADDIALTVRLGPDGLPESVVLGDTVVLLDQYTSTTVRATTVKRDGSQIVTTGIPLTGSLCDELRSFNAQGLAGPTAKATEMKFVADRVRLSWSTVWRVAGIALGTAKCATGVAAIVSGVGAPVGAVVAAIHCTTTGIAIAELFINSDTGEVVATGSGLLKLADCSVTGSCAGAIAFVGAGLSKAKERADEAQITAKDSDGDGVSDISDGCPQDPNKTLPGNCGCGVPEVSGCGTAGFQYPTFASSPSLTLLGAARISQNVLNLTDAQPSRVGVAWRSDRQRISDGFTTTFQFRISPCPYAADGLAFIIQNNGVNAIGGNGNEKGYGGLPNSLAVEFDNFVYNEISVQSLGTLPNSSGDRSAATLGHADIDSLADGLTHTCTVNYVPGQLSVFLDGALKLTVPLDISTLLQLEAGAAYIGFGAGTGEGCQAHDVLSWSFAPADSLAAALAPGLYSFPGQPGMDNGLEYHSILRDKTTGQVIGEVSNHSFFGNPRAFDDDGWPLDINVYLEPDCYRRMSAGLDGYEGLITAVTPQPAGVRIEYVSTSPGAPGSWTETYRYQANGGGSGRSLYVEIELLESGPSLESIATVKGWLTGPTPLPLSKCP